MDAGEVIAKQLAGLGAKLILSARDEAGLERVKNELSGLHFYINICQMKSLIEPINCPLTLKQLLVNHR